MTLSRQTHCQISVTGLVEIVTLTINDREERHESRDFKVVPLSHTNYGASYWISQYGIESRHLKEGRTIILVN